MRALLFAGLLVLCACPAPTTPTDGGSTDASVTIDAGPTIITFAAWCASNTEVQCGHDTRCGLYASTAGCALQVSRGPDSLCRTLSPSVRDGRITFDGAAASACVAALNAGCAVPEVCNTLLAGAVQLDGTCYFSTDCTEGFYCGDDTCPGHCAERSGVGQSATIPEGCKEGLYARFGELDGGDFGYLCETRREVGLPCVAGGCADGLICNDETQTCERLRPAGTTCTRADGGVSSLNLCADGLFCQFESAASNTRVCNPPAALGSRCGTCQFDLRCAATDAGIETCQALGQFDQPCRTRSDCAGGLYCRSTSADPTGPGVCDDEGAVGDSCNGLDEACASGLRCEFEGGLDDAGTASPTCVPLDGGETSGICTPP